LEQLVSISQTQTIAVALSFLAQSQDEPLEKWGQLLEGLVNESSLDVLNTGFIDGNLARVRAIDVLAALNRLRTISVTQT
jgi:hypothetical protein